MALPGPRAYTGRDPPGRAGDHLTAAADGARMLATVAHAVAAIHREGLLHLDLKPSNILLDRPPNTPREKAAPRVSDFGIASPWNDPDATATMTGSNGPRGTRRYMAPEQVAGDRKRYRAGGGYLRIAVVFYHVLTGHPPFSANSVAECSSRSRKPSQCPRGRLQPGGSATFETICLKCLQKSPARRYASAEALVDELRTDGWEAIRSRACPVCLIELAWGACRRPPPSPRSRRAWSPPSWPALPAYSCSGGRPRRSAAGRCRFQDDERHPGRDRRTQHRWI